jgi:putative transposase
MSLAATGCMITRKPEHLKSFDYLGLHQNFLTFCTYDRQRLFVESERVILARTQIACAAVDQRFALTEYCYMPDHVHPLVEGQSDDSNCREFISRAKQYSGFHYQAAFGRRLWQRYGFERTLRSEESAVSVAKYILENPVRAGLVDRVDRYKFSGSTIYTIRQILQAVQLDDNWSTRSG